MVLSWNRSITSPELWSAAFGLIIASQIVAGVLFLAGGICLWQERHASGLAFNGAKGLTIAGVDSAYNVSCVGLYMNLN